MSSYLIYINVINADDSFIVDFLLIFFIFNLYLCNFFLHFYLTSQTYRDLFFDFHLEKWKIYIGYLSYIMILLINYLSSNLVFNIIYLFFFLFIFFFNKLFFTNSNTFLFNFKKLTTLSVIFFHFFSFFSVSLLMLLLLFLFLSFFFKNLLYFFISIKILLVYLVFLGFLSFIVYMELI